MSTTKVEVTPAIVHGLRQVSATFKSDSFCREMAIPIDKALKLLDEADAAGPVGALEKRQRAHWELEPMAEQLRIAKKYSMFLEEEGKVRAALEALPPPKEPNPFTERVRQSDTDKAPPPSTGALEAALKRTTGGAATAPPPWSAFARRARVNPSQSAWCDASRLAPKGHLFHS